MKFVTKLIIEIVVVCLIFSGIVLYREINTKASPIGERVVFQIEQGQSLTSLADQLEERGIIRFSGLFKKYMAYRGVDTKLQPGGYGVEPPITLRKVVDAIANTRQNRDEIHITILPGWTIRDVAQYFEKNEIASAEEVYELLGKSAVRGSMGSLEVEGSKVFKEKPKAVSLEGYLAPETIRFFTDASPEEVLSRFVKHRDEQITDTMWEDIALSGRSFHEILTMASLLEREVKSSEDRALVSDLFWRRYDSGWALQADSTVHYVDGSDGSSVFTSAAQRDIDSPWNTYKYPGLPPGPIAIPTLDSIKAAIYPEKNNYWYFLTTLDTGEVKYASTLQGHNSNVNKYLR
ncbi:endolytic transglycosylase MltG [Candidatus Nomurabacteria bacterium]|nr:endolytic transglycosylase MltG [Candidatus Nomurabacteria bacterium]